MQISFQKVSHFKQADNSKNRQINNQASLRFDSVNFTSNYQIIGLEELVKAFEKNIGQRSSADISNNLGYSEPVLCFHKLIDHLGKGNKAKGIEEFINTTIDSVRKAGKSPEKTEYPVFEIRMTENKPGRIAAQLYGYELEKDIKLTQEFKKIKLFEIKIKNWDFIK